MAKIKSIESEVSNSSTMPRYARKPGMMGGSEMAKGSSIMKRMATKGQIGTMGRMGGRTVSMSKKSVSLPKKGGNGRNVTTRISGTVR